MVRYGRTCPDGFLPVMSVNTEEEARQLLTITCKRGYNGEFISSELAQHQDIATLLAFGERLEKVYENMKRRKKAHA